jgi:hypothetical protein
MRDHWLSGKASGDYAGFGRDWLEVRSVPWPEDGQQISGRVRYKLVDGVRRYWKADIDALFEIPSKARGPVRLVPKIRPAGKPRD